LDNTTSGVDSCVTIYLNLIKQNKNKTIFNKATAVKIVNKQNKAHILINKTSGKSS